MKFEIKNRWGGELIFSIETDSWKLAVEAAIKAKANLQYANLRYADLQSADLRYADLQSADLQSADLQSADLRYADLQSADLRYANLQSADLRYANLQSAKLDDGSYIETGETWKEYKAVVVPALLTAGGKALADVVAESWECHSWQNCPMAVAFSVHDLSKIPILLRPRAEQFIKYFDANMIPKPEVKAGE